MYVVRVGAVVCVCVIGRTEPVIRTVILSLDRMLPSNQVCVKQLAMTRVVVSVT